MPRNNAQDRLHVCALIESSAEVPAEALATYGACRSLPTFVAQLVRNGRISPWAAREFARMVDIPARNQFLEDIRLGRARCPSTSRLREINAEQRRAAASAPRRAAASAPRTVRIISNPEHPAARAAMPAYARVQQPPRAPMAPLSSSEQTGAAAATRLIADAIRALPSRGALQPFAIRLNELLDEMQGFAEAESVA